MARAIVGAVGIASVASVAIFMKEPAVLWAIICVVIAMESV